jgi:hypothetical protein
MSNGGWTKIKREAALLVRLWSRRMLLDTWHIEIEVLPKLKGSTICQVNWVDGYKSATLQISEAKWAEASDEYKAHTVAHELRHLFLAPVTEVLAKYVGYETLVWKAVNEELEKACETDAKIFLQTYRRRRT